MEIKQLDEKIFLYKKDKEIDFSLLIKEIENSESVENLWQISSLKNNLDTDFNNNKKVFYLDYDMISKLNIPFSVEVLGNTDFNTSSHTYESKKYILRNKLEAHCFDAIKDYINRFNISIKKTKKWSISITKEQTDFHHHLNKSNISHSYVVIVSLNNDLLGGEIQFENRIGQDKINMEIGDILIFPSGKEYSHRELSSFIDGKYYAVTYF